MDRHHDDLIHFTVYLQDTGAVKEDEDDMVKGHGIDTLLDWIRERWELTATI